MCFTCLLILAKDLNYQLSTSTYQLWYLLKRNQLQGSGAPHLSNHISSIIAQHDAQILWSATSCKSSMISARFIKSRRIFQLAAAGWARLGIRNLSFLKRAKLAATSEARSNLGLTTVGHSKLVAEQQLSCTELDKTPGSCMTSQNRSRNQPQERSPHIRSLFQIQVRLHQFASLASGSDCIHSGCQNKKHWQNLITHQ